MEEKFFAKHPDPTKQGVNISGEKYDSTREAIIYSLRDGQELTLKELFTAVSQKLESELGSSIKWYTTVVKLDLEAREIIERVPKAKPQRIRLK